MPRERYSTKFKYPKFTTEKRIKIPQSPERPLQFQARGIIRSEYLRKDPWWFSFHRRGPHRTYVGGSVLEARAMPKSLVRGTLPERILYRALLELLHFAEGVEFDFQSSLQGGRVELGGIVADFMFPYLGIVIQVQGPTHGEYIRIQKDREQKLALEQMGYEVYDLEEDTIYDEYALEDWLRKTFNWNHSGGGFQGESLGDYMGQFHQIDVQQDVADWTKVYLLAAKVLNDLQDLEGEIDVTL